MISVGMFIQTAWARTVHAAPATFEVNTTSDAPDDDHTDSICQTVSSTCSLRAAIEQANTNNNPSDQDKINFNISGASVHTLHPESAFSITQNVKIDGYSTQPGASPNTATYPYPMNGAIFIEIEGSHLPVAPSDLMVFETGSSGSKLTGVAINSANDGTIRIVDGTSDIVIAGNYFNTDTSGMVSFLGTTETTAILASGTHNLTIGGTNPADRNVLTSRAEVVNVNDNSTDIDIKGNYIEVGVDGITSFKSLHNTTHTPLITLDTVDNFSIGATTSLANFIENSFGGGIKVSNSTNGIISGNRIVGNAEHGIVVAGSSTNILIGGTNTNQQNLIFDNGEAGITVDDTSIGISILSNSIYTNGDDLGIDLEDDGLTANDSRDGDNGPNELLNYPLTRSISAVSGNTNVEYSLDVPTGDYRIEFFSNDTPNSSGNGDGQTFLGYQDIVYAEGTNQVHTATITGTGHQNIIATATQIDPNSPTGFGSTSEFGGNANDNASDLGITKQVVDQNEPATNGTISYNITVTNHGLQPINLTSYGGGGSNPITTGLFADVLPPELSSPISLTSNVACSDSGPGSASLEGSLFGNHSSYSLLLCSYTGSNTVIETGQSFTTRIQATVSDPLPASFTNFALHSTTLTDPDLDALNAAANSGDDVLDVIPSNNVTSATWTNTGSDLGLHKTLLNPADVVLGKPLTYRVDVTNNGPDPFDISEYDGSGNNPFITALFVDIVPPNLQPQNIDSQGYLTDLDNSNVSCRYYGSGSAAYAGQSLEDHSTYGIMICNFTGTSTILSVGDFVAVNLNFIQTSHSENFTNYIQAFPNNTDPNLTAYLALIGFGDHDSISVLSASNLNNFAGATYTAPGQRSVTQATQVKKKEGLLSATGETVMRYILIIIVLVAVGSGSFILSRSRRANH